MLLYNVGVVAILVLAWANQGMSGIALWPVVLAHAALAVWCVVAVSGRRRKAIPDEPVPTNLRRRI